MKVLVVDDDDDVRTSAEIMLQSVGHEVILAQNGQEALKILQHDTVDAVISDLLMPEIDGFELCRRMKLDPVLQNIPVIFHTATYADKKDEQFAKELGAFSYLLKPTEAEELFNTLNDAIASDTPQPSADPQDQLKIIEKHRDVLARKLEEKVEVLKAEKEALLSSEAKYRRLVESLGPEHFIYSHNTEGMFTYVSPSVRVVLGYEPGEFTGHYSQYLTENSVNREAIKHSEAIIAGEYRPGYELEIRHKDGSPRILEVFEQPVTDQQGKVQAVEGIAHDITRRKQSEEELEKYREHLEELVKERTQELEVSEEKYRNLYDNSPGLMISVDVETRRVVQCNNALLQALGYVRDEVIGKEVFDLYHADSVVAAKKVFQQFMATDEVRDADLTLAKKDGGKIDVLLDVSAYIDKRTGKKYTHSIWRDITERKRIDLNLFKAKEEAERANQAKSIFLANMSHELRTPLNAILGFSQLMARDADTTAAQQKYFGVINRSGEHLLAMINDILDLSKIEAGKIEFEPEAFDLHQLLKDVGEMIRFRAQARGLQFLLELDEDLVRYVQTDNSKLRQILINLLGNAMKFTEEGSVLLRVRSKKVDDIVCLYIEVEDTGCGIPVGQLEVIFEPFVQVGAVKVGQKGTGLGLSITRSFVELMGGTLLVESKEGKGSVFRVELPVEIAEATELIPAKASLLQVASLAPDQPQYRILIVEDEEENLQLLETLISQVGFIVQVARNGKEAIEIFQQWHPHFIWMDIRMPVVDGYEATQRIRALAGGKEVKIIALTASVFKEENDKIFVAGCNDVLHKPYKDYEIFDVMGRYLDVHYIYEEAATKAISEMVVIRPSAEALALLPAELLEALQKTARNLDMAGFNELLDQVASMDPELSDGLAALVNDFRFDEILKLFNAAGDKT